MELILNHLSQENRGYLYRCNVEYSLTGSKFFSEWVSNIKVLKRKLNESMNEFGLLLLCSWSATWQIIKHLQGCKLNPLGKYPTVRFCLAREIFLVSMHLWEICILQFSIDLTIPCCYKVQRLFPISLPAWSLNSSEFVTPNYMFSKFP